MTSTDPAADTATSSSPSSPNLLCEGLARIPYTDAEGVFYNKVQVFNRDLSILIIRAFQQRKAKQDRDKQRKRQKHLHPQHQIAQQHSEVTEPSLSVAESKEEEKQPDVEAEASASSVSGLRIFEALSATGLRSIRYFLEIPEVTHILVNDCDPKAVAAIHSNVTFNGLPLSRVCPHQGDAKVVMYAHLHPNQQFDVIDLDPYGSAAEFFDCSVQAVRDGGLLAVTCTDKAVLCGAWGEVAYAKYGGYALKGKICHEMAIRLVLAGLSASASRYKRAIVPLLSLSIDFYVRVFVSVVVSQQTVKHCASKMAIVYHCMGCEAFHLQRMGKMSNKDGEEKYTAAVGPPVDKKCTECSGMFKIGGPVWAEPLHDPTFIDSALNILAANPTAFSTQQRMIATLTIAKKELPDPFYWSMSNMCQTLHAQQPKIWLIRAAILNAGYVCSDTHALPDGIKTNAPTSFMWDIMRCYINNTPEAKGKHRQDLLHNSRQSWKENNCCYTRFLPILSVLCRTLVVSPNSPATAILSKPPQVQVDFTFVDGCDSSTKRTGCQLQPPLLTTHLAAIRHLLAAHAAAIICVCYWFAVCVVVKFLPNPENFWGPKTRAKKRKSDAAAHVGLGDALASLPAEPKKARLNQGRHIKKRLCAKLSKTGYCKFGDKCKFSHDPALLEQAKQQPLTGNIQQTHDEAMTTTAAVTETAEPPQSQ